MVELSQAEAHHAFVEPSEFQLISCNKRSHWRCLFMLLSVFRVASRAPKTSHLGNLAPEADTTSCLRPCFCSLLNISVPYLTGPIQPYHHDDRRDGLNLTLSQFPLVVVIVGFVTFAGHLCFFPLQCFTRHLSRHLRFDGGSVGSLFGEAVPGSGTSVG